MRKGDMVSGVIERVDYPNKGIVPVSGERVVVKNGIPGQEVAVLIEKKRSSGISGRIQAVLSPSPLESRPPLCSLFPSCGGCLYQTMAYEEQLKMKERQIRDLLSPFLDDPSGFEGIIASPTETAYRNKMEYSFGDDKKDGPLTLGLHRQSSTYDVLTATDCALVHPDMNRIVSCVLDYFTKRGVPYYHKMSHIGYLRHLLLRRGVTSGEILVNLVTTSQEEHDLSPLKEELLSLPLEGRIVGIWHLINDGLSDVVRCDEKRCLFGTDHFYETLLGLKFRVSTFSFFQPNTLAAERLYAKVREYIGEVSGRTVFDLYSGTGTIAQLSAKAASQVVGVEIVPEAVESARQNAAENGITNCRFIAGDVLAVLDTIPEKPDLLILDPPRDGIHPKALPKLLSYDVPSIVYISCKATSLVRDLPFFLAHGYRLKKVCPVDQFCQGPHVETVCLLTKNTNKK